MSTRPSVLVLFVYIITAIITMILSVCMYVEVSLCSCMLDKREVLLQGQRQNESNGCDIFFVLSFRE